MRGPAASQFSATLSRARWNKTQTRDARRVGYACKGYGEWLSLVEHLVRDQGVGGSNPLSPTIYIKQIQISRITFYPPVLIFA